MGAPTITLRASQARALHLAAQGLLTAPRRAATRADLARVFAQIHLVQIDTIHVVARSPYLVLYSRLGAYPQEWLGALLEAGAIFECWSHEACFAPIADYPIHRRRSHDRGHHWAARGAHRTYTAHRAEMEALLERVRAHGPVRMADFERASGPRGGGWWSWKPEKRWLEAWFALGELMIARRHNFHRVYDLRERVLARALPDFDEGTLPSAETATRELVLRAVAALGVTEARFVADYFRMKGRLTDADLDPLVESGELLRVAVNGWQAPGYVHRANRALATRAAKGMLRATHTTLLSPFDPVVWDRARARATFDFDYRLECYTPEPKRTYGYYVLPILRRGRLVGRLDAKAHRADGVFEVKALFLEATTVPTAALAQDLARALRASAAWHETPRVVLVESEPRAFARSVRQALRAL